MLNDIMGDKVASNKEVASGVSLVSVNSMMLATKGGKKSDWPKRPRAKVSRLDFPPARSRLFCGK